jgi:hypothetical protein
VDNYSFGVPCPVLFLLMISKRHIFLKTSICLEMCGLMFSTILIQTLLNRRRIQRDININLLRSLYKMPVIFVRFLTKFNFCPQNIVKTSHYKIVRTSVPLDSSCFLRREGRTDRQRGRHDEVRSTLRCLNISHLICTTICCCYYYYYYYYYYMQV